MTDIVSAMKEKALLADGAMGSYLFGRTGRLSTENHTYEVLNIENPELIRSTHLAYLQAGARCLTTNTFEANRSHLVRVGYGDSVADLNRAAVRLAREAIDDFRRQPWAEGSYFVLGSIGPTQNSEESQIDVREIYREQIDALLAEEVDALIIETFDSLAHMEIVLNVLGKLGSAPPVIAQLALRQNDLRSGWSHDPKAFVRNAAGLGASVVGVNCLAPWEALELLDEVDELDEVRDGRVLISVMPNAGGFQRIGHRYMTHVNAEYMGKAARTFAARGVRLIGGCCEVHPTHISEMGNYLQGIGAGRKTVISSASPTAQPVGDDVKRANGPFSRKIKDGEFAVSVEMLPPRGTSLGNIQGKIDLVARLASTGLADAVDFTDGSRGVPLISPADFIGVLRERLGWDEKSGDGIELIPHFTTRDVNVMGLQSRLIGLHAMRVNNALFITGDPPKMTPDYPRSTAVFDLDSIAMVRYAHSFLNAGVDFGGQPLGRQSDPRTHFTIGSGFEPEAVNLEREVDRLRSKIDNGVDYVMIQPAFRFEPLDVLEPFRFEVPILVGVMVLTSLEHARRVGDIPGVVVPDAIYSRFGRYNLLEDQAKVGREIAAEQIAWIKEHDWSGLYLMSPASFKLAVELLGETAPNTTGADQADG